MHFSTAYAPRLKREATRARPHQDSSMELEPKPVRPVRAARARRKSVRVPRTKKRTGTQSEMSPLTAKRVKKRFSTTRSPRISSWAPRGVERPRVRARWPSRPSRAMAVIVSATATASAMSELPKKVKSATAANAAATRVSVTWLGVIGVRPPEFSRVRHLKGKSGCRFQFHRACPHLSEWHGERQFGHSVRSFVATTCGYQRTYDSR